MKTMTNAEMRTVNGGYRLICDLCGRTKQTYSKVGVTAFLFHKAGHSQWVRYDIYNYKNAMSQWS